MRARLANILNFRLTGEYTIKNLANTLILKKREFPVKTPEAEITYMTAEILPLL